jgi:hypothetical protein
VTELRRAIPFLLLPLVLLVAGCGLLPWELPGVGPSPMPAGESAALLAENEQAWAASGIDTYVWELEFGCLCAMDGPVTVTVVDGQVTEASDAGGPIARDRLASFPLTVDAVYTEAGRALASGGTVESAFAAGGVPLRLRLDPIIDAVDDELSIEVLDFTPTP